MSYCDLGLSKELATSHTFASRLDIARILKAYRALGWNSATLYDASQRMLWMLPANVRYAR